MASVKIHPNKKKNMEMLSKVAYGAYHNMKHQQEAARHKHERESTSATLITNPINDPVLSPPPGTSIFIWCCACFCAIITILLIIAGLLVLIVFLLFHPKLPHLDVVEARINTISLDPVTYLLNSDMVFLLNFTNTNLKVDLKYEYINFKLYFRNELIGNEQLEPFEQKRRSGIFNYLPITCNDVELRPLNARVLVGMARQGRIVYKLLGTLRTRARFGAIVRVPYWLHAECRLFFSLPPNGTLVDHTCTTRR